MSSKTDLNNFPFAPARWPFFYGYAILGFGALGLLMSVPGQTMGVSPFVESLIRVLGLSRVELSTAYLIGTIASSFILTWAGVLYDRWGARVVAPGASFCLGLVVLGLSQVDWIAAQVGTAFGVMVVGFFLIRFFGQGVLTMVSRNMVMKWFDQRRGLANGIMGVGISFGFSLSPLLLHWLIGRVSWDGAWLALAVLVGGAFTVVAIVFFRDNAEACGLRPDGGYVPGPNRTVHRVVREFTLREARRHYAFWLFTLALSMHGLYITALTFHVASIFKSAGMTETQAFSIFWPGSIIAVCMHLSAGWLSDNIKLKYLAAVFMTGSSLALTGLIFLKPGLPVVMIIVGNGTASGLYGLLSAVTWPRFFGRKHLGAISGLSMSATVFGSAVGPWLFGQMQAHTGSYAGAGVICLAVTLTLLAGAFKADNPQDRLAQP